MSCLARREEILDRLVLNLHVGLATVGTVKEGPNRIVDRRDVLCFVPAVVRSDDLYRLVSHLA